MTTAAEARRWLRDVAGELGWPGPTDDLELAVSELVTNAVRYTKGTVEVIVSVDAWGAWVSVTDPGVGRLSLRQALPTDTSGRGLGIVETLSESWGVIYERASTSVWFEMPAPV